MSLRPRPARATTASAPAPATLVAPRAVLDISERLERAGFDTWCVGGAVRDALLGQPHADWDLATAARPRDVMRLFRRTVPIGVEHGTVGVLDGAGVLHEVTTFRRDVLTDGRHAVVEFGASLDDDLARRDFTINAVAYSPAHGTLYDPFGGRRDLESRIVRAVGDPAARIREDRLRALRALRFAARFDFAIDPETWAAIVASVPTLIHLSPERIRQELEKTMQQVRFPSRAFALWRDSGALATLVPALARIDGATLGSLDVLPPPVEHSPRRAARHMERLTALFVGDAIDEAAARAAARSLRFSNAQVEWIAAIAGRWQQLGRDITVACSSHPAPTEAAVRRWVSVIGRTRVSTFLRIAAARWHARRSDGQSAPAPAAAASLYRRAVRSAFRDPIEIADLSIDGDDLLRAGIPAGRAVGTALDRLLDAVIDDPTMNTPTRLLALAHDIASAT